MKDVFGFLMMVCLAICGFPQALKSFQDGHSKGVSSGFLYLWLIGEICGLTYILLDEFNFYLVGNYIVNLLFIFVILRYKYFSRES